MPTSNLHGLAHAGVSVWCDQISREMLDTGELARLIADDAVTGVTSNPTIFAGAIVGSNDYADQIAELTAGGASTEEVVKSLMATDITRACDILAPVHAATEGKDGFVSVEVSPTLAADTDATVVEAHEWTKQIDRPNLLVKVPATPEGIPAVRRLIGSGVSVNVTLIFSLQRYEEVIDAYLGGLEDLIEMEGNPSRVASVASFFVSRFDTEVDRRLDAIGTPEAEALKGKTAVANARAAYGVFLDHFEGPRYQRLAAKGARPQRPLWASTSTKNPAYSDLLYVENLVASNTVNTMPLKTIAAYQDHGDPNPRSFDFDEIDEARATLGQLEELGISYDEVVETLERDGVHKFAASWNELLEAVARS
ncbi:MAG: transaldolase [Acidimicrobiia bacterium]